MECARAGLLDLLARFIDSLSCPSAGSCALTGTVRTGTGYASSFVADERSGTWRDAQLVAGMAGLGAQSSGPTSISCASAGNCSAGGMYYLSTGAFDSFVVSEVAGTWGSAQVVPGMTAIGPAGDNQVRDISCASAGNCSAGGAAGDQAFVVNETGGVWGQAEEVPGISALNTGNNSEVTSISCASAGNCSAGGHYWTTDATQAFVVSETAGVWGTAAQVPGLASLNVGRDALLTSVSCGAPGYCAAGGSYDSYGTRAFVVSEANGTWGTAQPVTVTSSPAGSEVESVSCGGAGYCSAGGYEYSPGLSAFVVNEATASAVTLTLTRAKAAYGDEQTVRAQAAVRSGADGGTPTGTVTISAGTALICRGTLVSGAASCALPATLLRAGTYHLIASYSGDADFVAVTSAGHALTVTKAASKVGFSLSEATATYGHETSERLSVTVSAQYVGLPSGKVTIKAGKVVICTMTLAAGKASCSLTARQLKPGSYLLTAAYGGNAEFLASEANKTLKVVR
ncbi:MAG TPA: Ig-like domain-containing protein [Streptosporangiaceae bacterium]